MHSQRETERRRWKKIEEERMENGEKFENSKPWDVPKEEKNKK